MTAQTGTFVVTGYSVGFTVWSQPAGDETVRHPRLSSDETICAAEEVEDETVRFD